jgi:hemolysin III
MAMFRLDNEPMSFLTHLVGGLFAVAGLVLLIVEAVGRGTAWHVVSFSIFGSALVLLYLASSLYHVVPKDSPWKKRLQVLDHSMIFLLIAGTYTPISLVALRGAWGWSIFGAVWGLALFGIVCKAVEDLRHRVPHWIFVVTYAVMGWMAIVAIVPLAQILSGGALALLFTGGGLYTIGILFFALDTLTTRKSRWWGFHELWHLFVLGGSACHFCLIYLYLVPSVSSKENAPPQGGARMDPVSAVAIGAEPVSEALSHLFAAEEPAENGRDELGEGEDVEAQRQGQELVRPIEAVREREPGRQREHGPHQDDELHAEGSRPAGRFLLAGLLESSHEGHECQDRAREEDDRGRHGRTGHESSKIRHAQASDSGNEQEDAERLPIRDIPERFDGEHSEGICLQTTPRFPFVKEKTALRRFFLSIR